MAVHTAATDQRGTRSTFVVAANRLPLVKVVTGGSTARWEPSPGGLVAALTPVLAEHRGTWVGWPGSIDDCTYPSCDEMPFSILPIALTNADYQDFYEGFCNSTLWPLYHDLIVAPAYHQRWWEAYRRVNQRYADAITQCSAHGATVWIQDYQLQLVPGMLRETRPDLTIGFFLHIPFPGEDLFRQLPWRDEILGSLCHADLVGFQLERDAAHFQHTLAALGGESGGSGDSESRRGSRRSSVGRPHPVVRAFPISLDTRDILDPLAGMGAEQVRHDVATQLGDPERILLGVDRLDYTKGIHRRLRALEQLLTDGTLDPAQTAMIQIATPSRERVDHYQQTRADVEALVGRINGQFGDVGRPVVHYIHRTVGKAELARYYAAADIMLVTPFKDGMNLVAKEYVTAHDEAPGALVLSEFAGAAHELAQAHLCNPHHVNSIAQAIATAHVELSMRPDDAAERMRVMHEHVMRHDVHMWAGEFLTTLSHVTDAHAAEKLVPQRKR